VNVARGASRSRLPGDVLMDVCARIAEGAQEVVLSGVNIGAYGRDRAGQGPLTPDAGWSLARLVAYLLAETRIARLRLSSLEPWDVSDALLDLWSDSRLCRQLHLPLQSGSDAVLRRMGRPTRAESYRQLAGTLRARIGGLSLSTDLIVGFPGETEDDFDATYELAQAVAFSRLHVFRYSPRAGTPAAGMPARVPDRVALDRSRRLAALGRVLAHDFHRQFVGERVLVLFESPLVRDGVAGWSGLTDNYLRVWAPGEETLRNRFGRVYCHAAGADGLTGTLEQVT
jgi:threonylcarbamoyladenosine tRNA methylthiotransferase MtaB